MNVDFNAATIYTVPELLRTITKNIRFTSGHTTAGFFMKNAHEIYHVAVNCDGDPYDKPGREFARAISKQFSSATKNGRPIHYGSPITSDKANHAIKSAFQDLIIHHPEILAHIPYNSREFRAILGLADMKLTADNAKKDVVTQDLKLAA